MSHHNSPHLSHLNGSAPPSPSMSQAQQTNSQPRAYPEPTSYPSPSAYPEPNTSYASYPAPNGQQGSEPYRASASPAGSNGSLPLPSMRSLDPLHPHQQQMHPQSPMPYYAHQTMGQMPHPSHQYPNVTSDPAMANMRYALPVTDQRQMSGGRHKKEIKRRTKTGCLTCRKRRIKCDEQHPTCRNCQKSKRECLGYDPIFKQTPQPAQIQPAPQGIPQSTAAGINSNPYGAQPQMLQSGYGLQVTQVGYEQALSAGVSSPGSNGQQFDYASAIDPALEAAAPSAAASAIMTAQYPNPAPLAQAFENGTTGFAAASKFSIEELLAMGGPAPELPADQSSVQNPQIIDEQKHLYHSIYSVGLENFLESKWFPIKGVARLLADKDLMIQFGNLLQRLANTRGDDATEMAITSGVEARLVWALACMVRSAVKSEETPSSVSNEPANDDVLNAKLRLDIFENLLCGETAESNPLPEPSTTVTPPHRVRELDFWYNLGKFVSLNPDEPGAIEKIDQTLTTLRNLLDGRENRDVLYSIAIVRVLGARIAEYTEQDTPLHLDENDQRSRLLVAKKFIEDEARGNGTTNVIRRLCELAVRTWSSPRREQPTTTTTTTTTSA